MRARLPAHNAALSGLSEMETLSDVELPEPDDAPCLADVHICAKRCGGKRLKALEAKADHVERWKAMLANEPDKMRAIFHMLRHDMLQDASRDLQSVVCSQPKYIYISLSLSVCSIYCFIQLVLTLLMYLSLSLSRYLAPPLVPSAALADVIFPCASRSDD